MIVASPWSPPRSLKFPHRLRYGGRLKPWRYEQYAKYIRKWLEAYAAEGVNVNYITPQNEPRAIQKWESYVYSFRDQRRLAYDYLRLFRLLTNIAVAVALRAAKDNPDTMQSAVFGLSIADSSGAVDSSPPSSSSSLAAARAGRNTAK